MLFLKMCLKPKFSETTPNYYYLQLIWFRPKGILSPHTQYYYSNMLTRSGLLKVEITKIKNRSKTCVINYIPKHCMACKATCVAFSAVNKMTPAQSLGL